MEEETSSSKAEPDVSPQNDATLTYNKKSETEYAYRGISCLHGKIHCSKAVLTTGEE
jgi:hypothetical protein